MNQVELEKIVKRSLLDAAARSIESSSGGGGDGDDVVETALRDELERRERDLILAGEIGTALLEANRALQETKAELQDECARLQKEVERERVDGQRRLTEYSFDVQRDLQQLECDARQLKATLDAERKSHETKQNRLKSCANALRDENERLQEELASVVDMQRRDKARFQWQTLELQRAEKDVDEMRSELETLEKNNADLLEAKLALEEDLSACDDERDRFSRRVKELESQVVEGGEERDEHRAKILALTVELNETRQMRKELNEKLDEQILQNSLSKLDCIDGSLKAEIELSSLDDNDAALREERDRLKETNLTLQSELENLGQEVKQMESQLLVVVQQKLDLTQQLEAWQNDMACMVREQVRRRLDQQCGQKKRRNSSVGRENQ
ncbi:BICD family-like cargo adapter 2 [Oscarella lobularis]|uniref:BICD family-like cargo adapter 2 n=1 Tax=Oscarella lobularis TaxID=121494 RepID=UPI003313EB03